MYVEKSNCKALGAKDALQLFYIHGANGFAALRGKSGGKSCRMAELGAIGHDAVGGLRLVRGGDASAGNEEVFKALG